MSTNVTGSALSSSNGTTTVPINATTSIGLSTSTCTVTCDSQGNCSCLIYPPIFLQTPVAQGIAGVFAGSAIILAIQQIYLHLKYHVCPNEQKWIVRMLFIIPIYAFDAYLSLLLFAHESYYVYFDAVRSWYEAFVIWSFLSLCYAYLGGESSIMSEIRGKPIKRSWFYGTCCLVNRSYDISFLRFCKQATLQFCYVKVLMTVLTIILQAFGHYQDGDFGPDGGYLYTTIIYNVSISLALYALFLFYFATRHLLQPFRPLLKFCVVKAVIFVSFWQGVVLAILEVCKVISPLYTENGEYYAGTGTVAAGYQNFLLSVEILFAAVAFRFAFPISVYDTDGDPAAARSGDANDNGFYVQFDNNAAFVRNGSTRASSISTISAISQNLRRTVSPYDMFQDTIQNFHPRYHAYMAQTQGIQFPEPNGKSAEPAEEVKPDSNEGTAEDSGKRSPERSNASPGKSYGSAGVIIRDGAGPAAPTSSNPNPPTTDAPAAAAAAAASRDSFPQELIVLGNEAFA